MQYYKWTAYNTDGTEHSGSICVWRWEEVAIKLMARRLYPSNITKISSEEYKQISAADVKLDKMRRFKESMLPPSIEIPQRVNTIATAIKYFIAVAIVIGSICGIYLLF